MDHYSFERAKLSDSLRISILLKVVYIQAYGLEGVSFEFANFIAERFSLEKIEHKIQTSPDCLLIAKYKDNPIGVAEIIYDSECPIRKISIAELGKLYILDRFHGMGVAGHLIHTIEETVKRQGHQELNLEVWEKNAKAVRFYQKNGYKSLGKVDFPMETNTYINLVMHKVLM